MESLRKLLILLLAAMLTLPATVVAADSEDEEEEDDDDDDDRDDDRHEVEIEIEDDEIEVEFEQRVGKAKTKIEFKIDLDEGKFKLKFKEKGDEVETKQKLEVVLQNLIEFVDADGDGAYDEGETITSAYTIGSEGDTPDDSPDDGEVDWAQPTLTAMTVDNQSGYLIEARGAFGPNGNATFGLDVMVFGDFTMLNGSMLRPTDVKIDFLILDFPYTQNDTIVGLMMKTKTKQKQERDHDDIDDDEEGVVASSEGEENSVDLAFSWKNYANVDGVDLPVHTTVLRDSSSSSDEDYNHHQRFVLSYARGDAIIHDPVAGVGYSAMSLDAGAEGDGLFGLPGFQLVLAMTTIAGVALIARRDRACDDEL